MAEEENETNTPPEDGQPEPSSEPVPEDQVSEPQADADEGSEDASAEAPSDDEAAALAAAMAAVNQVQGVADSAINESQAEAEPFQSPELAGVDAGGSKEPIDLLSDVHMNVRIELGRTKMFVEDVLKLTDGAVVELDKLAGDPVDVFVNDRKVAKGEVLVLNDLFCVRINEIVDISSAAT
jgi:flagellar motor switch protein FliN